MKKKVLIIAALLASGFVVAQENDDAVISKGSDFNFGIKAGLNLARLYGDLNDTSTRSGAHFGVLAEIGIDDRFSLQPELLYSMQGVKESVYQIRSGHLKLVQRIERLNYLNLPIMAKVYISDRIALEVGPQIGLLLSNSVSDGDDAGEDASEPNEFMTVDFSFNAGLSYKLSRKIFFQGRYCMA